MKRKSLFALVIASVAIFTQSCDSDFNEIGSGVFGEDSFGFDTYNVQNLKTTTVNTGEASTKNLPINTIGVFNDPVFGKTTAHFVTQIEMESGTEFTAVGNNPVIDSVYVYIPYNSTVQNTDTEGNSTYKLNNTFGEGSFTMNVYENGYLLRNFDPNNNLANQDYFSSDKPLFDSNKKGSNGERLNNSSSTSQNTNFKFDANEIKLFNYTKEGELVKDANDKPTVKERKKPGIWLDLNKDYFQERFFANNKHTSLINNGILKEYFKGLYFNVSGNEDALAQLNIAEGNVVIVYKQDKTSADQTRERKTISLKIGNLSGTSGATTVNLIENANSTNYENQLNSNAASPMWIKGNNGSIATISLFGDDADNNGIADELETIKQNGWLINQAVLTVYVDKIVMTNETSIQPNRLFLYDVKNNLPLSDYTSDVSTSPAKNVYNGILDNTSENNTIKYRFRITNHINNLIKNDSTNVALGLAVSNDITNATFNRLKTPKTSNNVLISKIPTSSVTSPFGTVLFGPNHSDVNTRMKLDIYYTKQNN